MTFLDGITKFGEGLVFAAVGIVAFYGGVLLSITVMETIVTVNVLNKHFESEDSHEKID